MSKITKALEKILQELAGPAAGEVCGMIRDEVHPYKVERQLRVIGKAAWMIQQRGFRIMPVSPKILLPVLSCAAIEDNEQLHSAWAALLANAVMQEEGLVLTPVFVEILKQLSSAEITFLLHLQDFLQQEQDAAMSDSEFAAQSITLGTDVDLLIKYMKLGLGRPKNTREQALKNIPGDLRDFMAILDNLERLNLLSYSLDFEAPGWGMPTDAKGIDPVRIYNLTMLGYQFICACRPPRQSGAGRGKTEAESGGRPKVQ